MGSGMPTIKIFANCRITMYFDDHAPRHFHIIMNDRREVLVDLDGNIFAGSVSRREITEALIWAAEYRAELTAKWEELN
jgi:hypothetical protein